MTYEDLVNIFKDAAGAYVPVSGNSLSFHYDAVWYNNGAASNIYPSMLFERSPDFEIMSTQSNNRTGLQTFSGKLFFYDTFWQGERQVKEAYVKQSELNELALQILGEIDLHRLLTLLSQSYGFKYYCLLLFVMFIYLEIFPV